MSKYQRMRDFKEFELDVEESLYIDDDLSGLMWASVKWYQPDAKNQPDWIVMNVKSRDKTGLVYNRDYGSRTDLYGRGEKATQKDVTRAFKLIQDWHDNPDATHEVDSHYDYLYPFDTSQTPRVAGFGSMYDRIRKELDYDGQPTEFGKQQIAETDWSKPLAEIKPKRNPEAFQPRGPHASPIPHVEGLGSKIIEVFDFGGPGKRVKVGQFLNSGHLQNEMISAMIRRDFKKTGKCQIYWQGDNVYGIACFCTEVLNPTKDYTDHEPRTYEPLLDSESCNITLAANEFSAGEGKPSELAGM